MYTVDVDDNDNLCDAQQKYSEKKNAFGLKNYFQIFLLSLFIPIPTSLFIKSFVTDNYSH